MTLAELLYTIIPDLHVLDNTPTQTDDGYTPDASELTPGTVFRAIDEALYAPTLEWFMVIEPMDADGYLVVEVDYPDGTATETHIWAGHLRIVEVW